MIKKAMVTVKEMLTRLAQANLNLEHYWFYASKEQTPVQNERVAVEVHQHKQKQKEVLVER